jgi:deoxyribodipyrimidine photo-lyase
MTTLVWFRQDLRLGDNPALAAAAAQGPIVPVYILDETPGLRPIGGAGRWWLHHSLAALSQVLGGLVLRRGVACDVLLDLVKTTGATRVVWNRCYEPQAIARDTAIKAALTAAGVAVESHNGSLLFEPWQVKTLNGGPFKVYSPFWRACLKIPVAAPLAAPAIKLATHAAVSDELASWNLTPSKPDWAKSFATEWTPGEAGARTRLDEFLAKGVAGYGDLRNRPDLPNVSRLSPHLHWGEMSPRQAFAATQLAVDTSRAPRGDADKFLSEIGWREFAYHLLYHFPTLPERNWKPAFDAYPWSEDTGHLKAWQSGQTGYPIVDAGMRELWATGYMHNRVRMIVASFLIKHLRIDWKQGEAWFWDTLLDADLANNAASWQWVAGSGADAAPYFRIFNPMDQGRKFDPDGVYVRRWCPEIARLPNAVLHAPFEAPAEILRACGIALGKTYPRPLVNHAEARVAAMAGYQAVKAAGADAA